MQAQDSVSTSPPADTTKPETKSATGLPKDTAGALCYVGVWVTGLIFLLLERDKDVRFHALQSISIFGGAAVINFVLRQMIILDRLVGVVLLLEFILWLMLIYRTLNGEKFVVPFIGDWVEKQVKKMK